MKSKNEADWSYLYVDICETLSKPSCGSKVQQRHLEKHILITFITLKSPCQDHIIIIIINCGRSNSNNSNS